MALGGGFPTTHCCCVVGSSKRNKVRNILRVNYILDQFIVFGPKKDDGIINESSVSYRLLFVCLQ